MNWKGYRNIAIATFILAVGSKIFDGTNNRYSDYLSQISSQADTVSVEEAPDLLSEIITNLETTEWGIFVQKSEIEMINSKTKWYLEKMVDESVEDYIESINYGLARYYEKSSKTNLQKKVTNSVFRFSLTTALISGIIAFYKGSCSDSSKKSNPRHPWGY